MIKTSSLEDKARKHAKAILRFITEINMSPDQLEAAIIQEILDAMTTFT